ncbi:Beta-aspartyl-peptidase [Saliniradius amylolyticus]|uniref:Beta-aspartyl-peptidase n=1 Tax=Saliniradius amylolyticus TaxID=2183582 RepID=A0A2S2E1H1_9ALTE|nr:Type 1 glutamine amidotransferase-like domain-containing protein [Saliniradius amylolyticus]AWL11372.1 Beta-aspartyl-peptidase [Saliniradius amylolyticus]
MKHTTLAAALLMSFSFNASACLTSETETNDTESDANTGLCSDTAVSASIDSRQDVDWYSFTLASDGTIDVSLSHDSGDDFDWDLYEVTGSAVLSGATSNNPEEGSYQAIAGEHFIKVTRYSGTGNYQLNITFPDGNTGGQPEACTTYGTRPAKPSDLTASIVGNDVDVCPTLGDQAGVLLMGGGTDVDDAFSNRIQPHINGGDIVVLRASGTDAYNIYLQNLTGADSVETLIIDSQAKANSDYVDWAIRSAEFVWISGGDQSAYLNHWQGTKVQDAIDHVYAKNGVLGGTSAGNAVQSQYIYDPDGVLGSVSNEVVADFCHESINISNNFLSTDIMQNLITDTHFYERDRMGRMAVFLAHVGGDKRAIGVSEQTSVFFTENGEGVVDGNYEAYILEADTQTQFTQTECGKPVIIDDLLRYYITAGDRFNILTGATNVTPIRLDIDGTVTDFYNPSNPY